MLRIGGRCPRSEAVCGISHRLILPQYAIRGFRGCDSDHRKTGMTLASSDLLGRSELGLIFVHKSRGPCAWHELQIGGLLCLCVLHKLGKSVAPIVHILCQALDPASRV